MTIPNNARIAQQMKELEINMNMIQLKMFLDNSETILTQVKALGIPLHDCIVSFDLQKCPPAIKVDSYTTFIAILQEKKLFEKSRSKENITCVYNSSIYHGELDDKEQVPRLVIQRLFPHEWLKKQRRQSK